MVSAVCESIYLFALLFVFVICDDSFDRVLLRLLLFHRQLPAMRAVQNAFVLLNIKKENVRFTL